MTKHVCRWIKKRQQTMNCWKMILLFISSSSWLLLFLSSSSSLSFSTVYNYQQHAAFFHGTGQKRNSKSSSSPSSPSSPSSSSLFMTSTTPSAASTTSTTTPPPTSSTIPSSKREKLETVAENFLNDFQNAWNSQDISKISNFFIDDNASENDDETNDDTDDNDVDAALRKVSSTPFWRDMVAFTWNICTNEGKVDIEKALSHIKRSKSNDYTTSKYNNDTTKWTLSSKPLPIQETIRGGIEFWCDITLDGIGTGKAHFRLVQQQRTQITQQEGKGDEENKNDNTSYRIHTLLTTLMELSDKPFQIGPNRIRGQIHGPISNRLYWNERQEQKHNQYHRSHSYSTDDRSNDDERFDDSTFALIIGGGQAGLGLGARLHYMDVPYKILESGTQPGMAWKKRYPSLHLHDPVWYNHMPYLPFPETWPILCPRDKVADWMEYYAKVLDLNVQTNTRVVNVTKMKTTSRANNNNNNQDENDGSTDTKKEKTYWLVQVEVTTTTTTDAESEMTKEDRLDTSSSSTTTATTTTKAMTVIQKKEIKTIRCEHVIFATGNSSHPRIPKFDGYDKFIGQQLHSSKYSNGGRKFAGKRVVVIGSNNSGFDIVQDLWEQGAKSVVMIQRSSSLVVSTESVLKHGLGPLYRQDAPLHHEDADLVATTMPYKMLLPRWTSVTSQMKEVDAELHAGLIKAGYHLDFGPNGTGLFAKSATEGGGFYINMGCAELLMDPNQDVSIRFGKVVRIEENAVIIQHHGNDEENNNGDIINDDTPKGQQQQQSQREESLPADVIIYATGFHTMDSWVEELCGKDISLKIGRTWGLGYGKRPTKDPGPWEGELRNMWKPTTIDGLWFHGGNLAQARHYSKFVSLQLAARYIGLQTPVYGTPKPTLPSSSSSP